MAKEKYTCNRCGLSFEKKSDKHECPSCGSADVKQSSEQAASSACGTRTRFS